MSVVTVVRVKATIESFGGRQWLLFSTDRVLNLSNRALNLRPDSSDDDKKLVDFELAYGLFRAEPSVSQINTGINDCCAVIVLADERVAKARYLEIAQRVCKLLRDAGCEVIVDKEASNNLLRDPLR